MHGSRLVLRNSLPSSSWRFGHSGHLDGQRKTTSRTSMPLSIMHFIKSDGTHGTCERTKQCAFWLKLPTLNSLFTDQKKPINGRSNSAMSIIRCARSSSMRTSGHFSPTLRRRSSSVRAAMSVLIRTTIHSTICR